MLPPGSGIGVVNATASKAIRLLRVGCTNRPFFHIVVAETKKSKYEPVIEQLGSYDPMPNQYNEKLVSLNMERICHWIGNGADISTPVAELLGLAGAYPIHPRSYMTAWRNRQKEKANNESVDKENAQAGTG